MRREDPVTGAAGDIDAGRDLGYISVVNKRKPLNRFSLSRSIEANLR